jgi:hypothetical protein
MVPAAIAFVNDEFARRELLTVKQAFIHGRSAASRQVTGTEV